jgi:hypothetical protein
VSGLGFLEFASDSPEASLSLSDTSLDGDDGDDVWDESGGLGMGNPGPCGIGLTADGTSGYTTYFFFLVVTPTITTYNTS